MLTAFDCGMFYPETNIRKIMESLPLGEIEHMRRVGILVDIMSSKVSEIEIFRKGSNLDEYQYYGQATAYHDIGKAWIPIDILTKPDKLTKEERDIMHQHPVLAHELFNRINHDCIIGIPKRLFKLTYDSAVYHHEWWNGTGYPYGIHSNNIPLVARITSICDAYDAMTSNRPYSAAYSHNYACNELKVKAGIQFDPRLVQVFLNHQAVFSEFTK